jgi:hypothetical protein
MKTLNIVVIVLLILLIIWALSYLFLKTNIIYDTILDASKTYSQDKNMIKSKNIPMNSTSNFTMSIWFFVDNWGNNISRDKNILFLGESNQSINKNVEIKLDKYNNDLHISLKRHPLTESENSLITQTFKITNIPIQKWVCLTISVDNKTIDVYIDGKLRNSFIMDNTYNQTSENAGTDLNIYLGNTNNNDGFKGFITRFRYIPHSIDPQYSYNIYKDGINKSLLNSLYNKYSLKVSFLEYNKPVGEFSI